MVSKSQIGIGTVIAICAIAAGAVLYPTTNQTPGEDVAFDVEDLPSMVTKSLSKSALHTLISYHDYRIYERTEFKVEVTDSFSNPIEGANVSFMIPGVFLHTNNEGYVLFSAPVIRDEYLAEANDIKMAFPLTVTKEGYEPSKTNITVHIRQSSA